MKNFVFLLHVTVFLLSFWSSRCSELPPSQKLNEDLVDASYNGEAEKVEKLLSQGADVNYKSKESSQTPLHLSVVENHAAVVSILLRQKGINMNAVNKYGATPLCYSAVNGLIQIAQMLLNTGANINKQTPLHKAAYRGNLEMVKLLIERGADPSLRNKDGNDAYQEALRGGYDEVIEFLEEIKKTRKIEEYTLYAGVIVLAVCLIGGAWLLFYPKRQPHSPISSVIVETLISIYARDIDQALLGHDKQGLAIVIGMRVVEGGEVDAKNMEKAFQDLNFAVIKLLDIDINQLYAIIRAASELKAPPSIKVIAFYFAGHGGSISGKMPFVVASDKLSMTVQAIVSPFYPANAQHLKDLKHLFFFDVCLGTNVDPSVRDENFFVSLHGNTLSVFANSIGFKVRGDLKDGGYWTRFLSKNIVKDQDIYLVLAETWNQTFKFRSQGVQEPTINTCMRHVNLRCLGESVDRAAPSSDQLVHTSHQSDTIDTPINVVSSLTQEKQDLPGIINPQMDAADNNIIVGNQLGIDKLAKVKTVLRRVNDWQSLGLQLGLLDPTLEQIENENPRKVEQCKRKMLAAWLKRQDNVEQVGVPSWSVLQTALRAIGENEVANQLSQNQQEYRTRPPEQ